MNINLTSSVNNINSSSASKDLVIGADGESVSEQSDGFFDKLSSLLFSGQRQALAQGEDSSADSAVDSAIDIDAAIEPNSEQASVENTDENDAKPSVSGVQANASIAAESLSTLSSAEEAAEMDVKPLSHQRSTEQVMHDGEDMLERLHQANQTLSAYHGKSLPQDLSTDESEKINSLMIGAELESSYPLNQASSQVQSPLNTPSNVEEHKGELGADAIQLNSAMDLTSNGVHSVAADRYQADNVSDNGMPFISKEQATVTAVSVDQDDLSKSTNLAQTDPEDEIIGQHSGVMDKTSTIDPNLVVASGSGHVAMNALLDENQVVDNSEGKVPKKLAANISSALTSAPMGPPSSSLGSTSNALSSSSNDMPPIDVRALSHRVAGQEFAQSPALDNLGLKTALAGSMVLTGKESVALGQATDEASLAQQIASTAVQSGTNLSSPLRNELTSIQAQPLPLMTHKGMVAEEMSERIQMMMSKNLKNIDIRLDPPELGRMQIRMNLHSEGASVQFTVTNHQAREALEGAMPRLREMLAQQGIQLADSSVQQQSSGQQQGYAFEQHSQGKGNKEGEELVDGSLDNNAKLDINLTAKRDGISYYA